jgi:hypothetical protein
LTKGFDASYSGRCSGRYGNSTDLAGCFNAYEINANNRPGIYIADLTGGFDASN